MKLTTIALAAAFALSGTFAFAHTVRHESSDAAPPVVLHPNYGNPNGNPDGYGRGGGGDGFRGNHFGGGLGGTASDGYGGYGNRASGLRSGYRGYAGRDVWGHWGTYYGPMIPTI
jgi:hypothetical protein